METNIKFNYPSSEKVYLSGKLYPEIKVGMRKVSLTPTITVEAASVASSLTIRCTYTTQVVRTATLTWK